MCKYTINPYHTPIGPRNLFEILLVFPGGGKLVAFYSACNQTLDILFVSTDRSDLYHYHSWSSRDF